MNVLLDWVNMIYEKVKMLEQIGEELVTYNKQKLKDMMWL